MKPGLAERPFNVLIVNQDRKSIKNRLYERVKVDLARIEQELRAQVLSSVPLANTVGKYVIESGGKRLRPLLTVLCARLCGYDGDRDVRLALAFEFLHVATLLHDDVIDHAEVRRNRPAANTLWGNQAVVLVGDYLYSKALMLSVEYGDLGIIEVITRAANLMAEGEVLQLQHIGNVDMTEEEYYQVIWRKTAVLMSSACRAGAMLAGATPHEEALLNDYGYHLGMAFQLIDDLLDYSGTVEELGKPVGLDFAEHKATLPFIYALKNALDGDREKLIEAFSSAEKTAEVFQVVREIVERSGGIEYTERKAREHILKAHACLEKFPESEAKRVLYDLASFVVTRRN
ncbi:polyprenyl synthetase family protein [Thermodesulforhabdus norvegica]|uniref:Octaprenyl-diphosphate synthase n=1 Tax=Thermodesulforhabdus norvegica TaxID=39841 RepID=A0A1I4UUV7_9BACT|nr:polyprenyl synthetase family protein [Thermodesulforhabdus norvegica]SFM92706.1 octaprenyl-diphosphate synthase [Thermodesulforhabdus norvegica]